MCFKHYYKNNLKGVIYLINSFDVKRESLPKCDPSLESIKVNNNWKTSRILHNKAKLMCHKNDQEYFTMPKCFNEFIVKVVDHVWELVLF